MPVLEADDHGGEGPGRVNGRTFNRPFGLMLRALDDLQNEIYVCTGSSPEYALWESPRAPVRRTGSAAGAIVDGYSRDTRGILALGFPVFSYGRYAQGPPPAGQGDRFSLHGSNGRAVTVSPPHSLWRHSLWRSRWRLCHSEGHREEVIEAAWLKAHGEKRVFEAIKGGMGAQAAWDTFGIL